MNIQVIGTKKCKETRAVERFFKDRGISFHFADLTERGISKGELDKIISGRDPMDLLNTESKIYKDKGFKYMDFNPVEEILENPSLLVTPIVRIDKKVIVGNNSKELMDAIKDK